MANNNKNNKFNNKNQKPFTTWIQRQVNEKGQGWIVQPNEFDIIRNIDNIVTDLARTTWSEDSVDYKCYCNENFIKTVYNKLHERSNIAILIVNLVLPNQYSGLDESHEIKQIYNVTMQKFINIANSYKDINEALYIFAYGIKDVNGMYVRLPHDISVLIQLTHNLQGFKKKFLKLGVL